MIVRTVLASVLLLALSACGDDTAGGTEGVNVVVTTGVLADVVADLVGDRGSVESLMGPGADPHDFSLSPEQVARLRSSDLAIANGLGLEAGLEEVLESTAEDGTMVIELAEHVDPLPFGDHQDEEGNGEHGHGGYDPHFTLDPLRMADGMDVVAAGLSEVDASGPWEQRAGEIRAELEALHRDIEDELASIPTERRKLVTNHDALGYFADRYGFEVVGNVIPGGSTLAEPSASDLADLAAELRREDVTAIFAETSAPVALAEAVAAEVGEEVRVHELYTGSLGPEGSDAATYAGMMRANASIIVSALGS